MAIYKRSLHSRFVLAKGYSGDVERLDFVFIIERFFVKLVD